MIINICLILFNRIKYIMASLFMNVGSGRGSWCSKYDSDTEEYIECAHHLIK